jgi:acyl-coenzyme A thioesterase PaaI-like protein
LAASAFILALASVQSDLVISLKPVPLQLFMPLQLFLADLQSDMPLQEFTPEQCMVAASAAKDAVGTAAVNNIAAAAAMAALDTLLMCMIDSSIVIECSDIAAPYLRPAQRVDYYPIV